MIDEQIGRLEQHIEYMRNFTLDPKHIKPVAEQVLRERHMFSWSWYVIIAIILGLIVLIGIGGCLIYLRRQRLVTLWNILSRRGTTPVPEQDPDERQRLRQPAQELPIIQRHVNREHSCGNVARTTPRPRPRSEAARYTPGSSSELQFGMDEDDDDYRATARREHP
jgi:hypothetical protein